MVGQPPSTALELTNLQALGFTKGGGGREGKGSLYGLKKNPSHPQGARERGGGGRDYCPTGRRR